MIAQGAYDGVEAKLCGVASGECWPSACWAPTDSPLDETLAAWGTTV